MDQTRLRIVGDIPDDAPLWRYIRLSTLLTLLNGTVFIPTIKNLQWGDPNEASTWCSATMQRFKTLSPNDQTLLLSLADDGERKFIQANPGADHWQSFYHIWLRQISVRRCAWCWYHGNIESMAQWHVYARDGVAIRTTPRRIKAAISPAFADYGLIAPIVYSDDCLADSSLFLRPYLQKQTCYRHEQEVRAVFPCQPPSTGGIKLPIDGRKLLDQIVLSPLLPMDEARELRKALQMVVDSPVKDQPDYSSHISVTVSTARLRLPVFPHLFPFSADPTGITNFGTNEVPFLMGDDILREYPDEHKERIVA